jgi:hypothetical protein
MKYPAAANPTCFAGIGCQVSLQAAEVSNKNRKAPRFPITENLEWDWKSREALLCSSALKAPPVNSPGQRPGLRVQSIVAP